MDPVDGICRLIRDAFIHPLQGRVHGVDRDRVRKHQPEDDEHEQRLDRRIRELSFESQRYLVFFCSEEVQNTDRCEQTSRDREILDMAIGEQRRIDGHQRIDEGGKDS